MYSYYAVFCHIEPIYGLYFFIFQIIGDTERARKILTDALEIDSVSERVFVSQD